VEATVFAARWQMTYALDPGTWRHL